MDDSRKLKLIFSIFALIFISNFFLNKICIADDKVSAEGKYSRIENKILESKGKQGNFKRIIRECCSSSPKESFTLGGHTYDTLTGKPVSNVRVYVSLAKSYKMNFLTDGPIYFFAKQWSHKPVGTKTIKAYKTITDNNGYFEIDIHKEYIEKAEHITIDFCTKRPDKLLHTYEIYKIENNGVIAEIYLRGYGFLFRDLYLDHYAQRREVLKDMNLAELYPLQDIIEKYGYGENIDEFFELSEKFLRKTYPSYFLSN